jgi:phage antirepressor YoqD-like protein
MKELNMLFENKEVKIIDIDARPQFEIYSTGLALGYVNYGKNKNNPLPHKSRIEKVMKNAGIKGCVHGVNTYMNEQELFDFMLEAHTAKCKDFRKWVTTEVLPTINKTGGYVEQNSEEKFVENYLSSLSDETKKIIILELENKNKELQEFYNDLLNTEGLMDINTAAKELNIGEYKLFEYLRDKKILFYNSDFINMPYERFRKEGKFQVKKVKCRDGKYRDSTLISNKGLDYIRKLLHKDGMICGGTC